MVVVTGPADPKGGDYRPSNPVTSWLKWQAQRQTDHDLLTMEVVKRRPSLPTTVPNQNEVTTWRQIRSQADRRDKPDANLAHHLLPTLPTNLGWNRQPNDDLPTVKLAHQLANVTRSTPKQFMMVGTSTSGCPRLRLGIVNGKKCLERGLKWLKKF